MSDMQEDRYYGPEPTWSGTSLLSSDSEASWEYVKALNWYNYMTGPVQHKAWILDYMKFYPAKYTKEDIELIQSLELSKVSIRYGEVSRQPELAYGFDAGVHARLSLMGAPQTESIKVALETAIDILKKRAVDARLSRKEVAESKEEPVKTVQDHVREQVSGVISELETNLDRVLHGEKVALKSSTERKPTDNPVREFLSSKNLKPIHCNKIIGHYKPQLSEFSEAVTGGDAALSEGYASYSKKTLKSAINYLETVVEECQSLADLGKSLRNTVRKKRKKSPVDIVKKLQYCPESKEFGLKSISAISIVGADKLVLFNVKYRTCTLLEAKGPDGLSVKGTTVIGFDEKKSICKKVRKPAEFLKAIGGKGGIRAFKKVFDALKVKEQPAKGRCGEDTILYGVY